MPDPVKVDELAASNQASAEALRTDDEGHPVYPEWSDTYVGGGSGTMLTEGEPGSWTDYDQDSEAIQAEVTANWDEFRRKVAAIHFDSETLMGGVDKVYSTKQAAAFFGRSTQWIYWGLRKDPETGEQVFAYRDGTPIQPIRVGKGARRRFTLPIIREIALCCYRRGNIKEGELQEVMARILVAEFGEQAFA